MTANAHTLDARGLNCPLPILRTRKAIAGLDSGEVLEVAATDPGSVKDIDSFCRQTGHKLLSSDESGGSYLFRIRKA
ncbi:MAG: sulfurtransferase TusA family protein [Pseudomonadota bacterium]|nr:sulfurtransferase TusA family protein [Pseudomonadota bacterium]